jgi:4'-phosphopantetheinyl transferase
MNVYWMEQIAADVPRGDAWLSPAEVGRLRAMPFLKRRHDWLLGRWTAKNAVAIFLDIPAEPQLLREIEIRPALSGAPEVYLGNDLAIVHISISHRAGIGACAVTRSSAMLGCDLEIVEPHSAAFVSDYFTIEEQAFLAEAAQPERLRLLSLFWSAKESALKALREGLRLDPRQVVVSFPVTPNIQSENQELSARRASIPARMSSHYSGWSPLQVDTNGQTFQGWWSQTGDLLRTLLAAPPPDPPVLLAQEHSLIC